jgi:hypothetical protein
MHPTDNFCPIFKYLGLLIEIMGFLEKIKEAILGGKEKSDEAKIAAAKTKAKVDESADKAKRDAAKTKVKVDESADKAKRAGDKAENTVDDMSDASDELKKE